MFRDNVPRGHNTDRYVTDALTVRFVGTPRPEAADLGVPLVSPVVVAPPTDLDDAELLEVGEVGAVLADEQATGIAACDLPPRYDAVDPDALDGLFERRPDPSVRSRPRSAGSGPGVRGCSR